MAQIWESWALWQKICFILAVLLFFVLVYALVVNIANKRRLKRYQSLFQENHHAERGEIIRAVSMKKKNAVPFGARALERGIGVDGIWISRHNTPTTTPVDGTPAGTPPMTPKLQAERPRSSLNRANRMSIQSVAEENENSTALPAYQQTSSRPSSLASSNLDLTQNPRDRRQSSASGSSDQGNGQRSGSVQSRHSANDHRNLRLGRSSTKQHAGPPTSLSAAAFDALEAYASPRHRLSDPSSSTRQQRSSSAGPSYGRGSSFDQAPDLSFDEAEHRKSDLESLYSHRLSHAAEIGQLVPRVRRSRQNSDESSRTAMLSLHDRSVDSQPTAIVPSASDNAAPETSVPRPDESISALPQITNDARPTKNEKRKRDSLPSGERYVPQNSDELSHRNSVTRRVNAGFEVLPAGTFGIPPASNEDTSFEDREADQKPKKLQKRRPSSVSSRRSQVDAPIMVQTRRDRSSTQTESGESFRGRPRRSSFKENI